MQLSKRQANELFDVLLNTGDHQTKYSEHRREDFIHTMGNGIGEYWYPTNRGNGAKLYFGYGNRITFANSAYYSPKETDVRKEMEVELEMLVIKWNVRSAGISDGSIKADADDLISAS